MQKRDERIGTIRRAMASALSLSILGFPAVAAADNTQVTARAAPQQATAKENPRALGGFVFQPPATLEGPFITNHIRMETGLGALQKDAVEPEVSIPGAPATYDLRLGFLQQRANVGLALTPNLSLGLDGNIIGYGGANNQSALMIGSGVGFEARPSFKIGLVNEQNIGVAVSVRAYGIASRAMGLSPAGMLDVKAGLAGTQRAADTAERGLDMNALGGGVSMSAAKNIGKFVGVQMEVGGEGSRVTGGKAGQARIDAPARTLYAGTAASVDLSPIAPVGAMLEYRIDSSVISGIANTKASASTGEEMRSNMHRMSAGVYYTARENLVLGAVGTYALARGNAPGASAVAGPARVAGGRLTVGYYF